MYDLQEDMEYVIPVPSRLQREGLNIIICDALKIKLIYFGLRLCRSNWIVYTHCKC